MDMKGKWIQDWQWIVYYPHLTVSNQDIGTIQTSRILVRQF